LLFHKLNGHSDGSIWCLTQLFVRWLTRTNRNSWYMRWKIIGRHYTKKR